MLPHRFELHQPITVDDTVELMKQFVDDLDFIFVGTDLFPNYKFGPNARKNVISLEQVYELK